MLSFALVTSLLLTPVAPASAAPARTAVHAKRTPAAAEVLPFIADDYPKAVALAKARKLPLFVEAWAPW